VDAAWKGEGRAGQGRAGVEECDAGRQGRKDEKHEEEPFENSQRTAPGRRREPRATEADTRVRLTEVGVASTMYEAGSVLWMQTNVYGVGSSCAWHTGLGRITALAGKGGGDAKRL
jgi:hypothetical protein